MPNARTLIIEQLEAGKVVDLDDFGVERVEKSSTRSCGACESPYVKTHGGYGSVCFECGEPWFNGRFVDTRPNPLPMGVKQAEGMEDD